MNTLKHYTHIHFVGIKGVGMSGLAVIAKELAFQVTGSDTKEHFITETLLNKHLLNVSTEFSEKNITDIVSKTKAESLLLIYTAAHGGRDNVEVQTAIKHGCNVMSYGQALGIFMEGKKGISVAGAHGKTTTTAILAHIITKAGFDPSFLVGTSDILSLNTSAHAGRGDYFIAEADEYVADPTYDRKPKLLYQHPQIAVFTTIDWDHPD